MTDAISASRRLRSEGSEVEALRVIADAASAYEIPPAPFSLEAARAHHAAGEHEQALEWCLRVTDADDDFRAWQSAAQLANRLLPLVDPPADRTVRLAVLGSYTTTQLIDLVKLMGLRRRILLDIYEAPYGVYQQEMLDPASGLYRFDPHFIFLAVHEGELHIPRYAADPTEVVTKELDRWRGLWAAVKERSGATIIQSNFVSRPEDPFGHLSARLAGTRRSMTEAVNEGLGAAADGGIAILDCEQLANLVGKTTWFDDRYWAISKQAVGFEALPLLARHLVAILAGQLGMARKCLVVDLDNTLWGGVIGEDGLEGIRLGHGAEGESFVAFQEYLLALKERGVIMAVCSKNDEAIAREAIEKHPDMRLTMDDFAAFVANWEPKPTNLRSIADTLSIGLDSLVFVDDNPAERAAIRVALPEVDVIPLRPDPASFLATLGAYPFFETPSYTEEDAARADQYRARAETKRLESETGSLEDFLRSLEMVAEVCPFDELHLPRIAQLIGKTNQFNVTTRRHSQSAVEAMMNDSDVIHFYLKLRDRFADHGLVSLMIARREGEVLDIDTWLMSCRVIGRTVEQTMLAELESRARHLGCHRLRGTYIATEKNGLVADLYESLGFGQVEGDETTSTWERGVGPDPKGNELIMIQEDK